MIRGACIIIEQSLGRPLLWLACWHLIHEVVLKDTYEFLFDPPQVPRFPCSSSSEEDGISWTRHPLVPSATKNPWMRQANQRLKIIDLVALIQRFQAQTKDENQKQ